MDELCKSIDDYLGHLSELGSIAEAAVIEELDKAVNVFESTLRNKAAKISKGLANSIQRVPTDKKGRYGFTIRFVGELPKPKRHYKAVLSSKTITTYQGLASLFDHGDKKHKATKFVTSTVRKLKGLDNKIITNYELKLKKEGLL